MNQTTDPRLWRTRRGETLVIARMDDSHLLNVVMWLRRQASDFLRSEHNVAAQESSKVVSDLLNRSVPQYPTMLAELERRGLGRLAGRRPPRRRSSSAFARFAELIFDQ